MRLYVMSFKKAVLFLLAFSLFRPFYSQEAIGQQGEMILIDNVIDYQQFDQIRNYIIEKGDQKEYCARTGIVPHYKLQELDSDFFIVSFSNKISPRVDDYIAIYYVTDFNERRFNFYLTVSDTKNIYLYDYRNELKDETIRQLALERIKTGITRILSEIEKG